MRKNNVRIMALAFVVPIFSSWPAYARAQVAKAPYPVMAPLDQYLISDENAEIALARSAAPASISNAAEVMVLRRDGYATAVKGSNGFVCIVERSWANTTDDPQFWNPKVRAPHCFNAPAARTFLPILSDEDQTGAGRKIEGGDRSGYRVRTGKEGTAGACAGDDGLHDVEATVSERQRQELASTCHVLCFG